MSVITKLLNQTPPDPDTLLDDQGNFGFKMEHSYSRDCRPIEGANGLKTRTLMIHRPPQCPSCHAHPIDENNELDEANHPPFPSYNETIAKDSMTECTRVANSVRNTNSDDVNWENCVNKNGWTALQTNFFTKITRILDFDHLGRLATIGKQHEPIQKRTIIDKSAQRMRKTLASIAWDTRLTQWLHSILMECLPPLYMASYLDILQTLKTKLPTLMDKMLFGKPMNINQDLLTPVMKKQWEPVLPQKTRKLSGNAVIVVIPSTPLSGNVPPRMQKWYQLFATMGQIVQITAPSNSSTGKQPIEQVIETVLQMTRIKIQELKHEQPTRHIVLVGFNAGASIALQVAYTENVHSIVCMGFAFNTINGTRGAPDDHILDITIPIMFVIGQNSARTSQEEIESLREKMLSDTSLLIIGTADDVLRIPKNKRQIENVTQSMVDNMVTDEVYEFIKNCITNPPGPRTPTSIIGNPLLQNSTQNRKSLGNISTPNSQSAQIRKRKSSQDNSFDQEVTPIKKQYNKGTLIGRPRTRNITPVKQNQPELIHSSNEALSMAIQSILQSPNNEEKPKLSDNENVERTLQPPLRPTFTKSSLTTPPQVTTIPTSNSQSILQRNFNATAPQKIKLIPPNQYVQLKPPLQSQSKIYTIKTTSMAQQQQQNISSTSGNSYDNMPALTINRNQGQMMTIKSNSNATTSNQQYTTALGNQIILNPQKFTVIKSGTNTINIGNSGNPTNISETKTDYANIFDMPILFADNDGNLHDSTTKLTGSPSIQPRSTGLTSLPNQVVIKHPVQTNFSKEITVTTTTPTSSSGTFLLNPSSLNKSKTSGSGKVVFINRNTMKPCPNIISKSAVPPLKYTKVVVTNPKTSTPSLVTRATGINDASNASTVPHGTTITITSKQQQPINIVKPMQPSSGILNLATTSSATATTSKTYPILLNLSDSSGDKTNVKNVIKMDPSQMKQTILLKPGSLVKQMPMLKTSPLNKNLTVKRVMNFIPSGNNTNNIITSTSSSRIGNSAQQGVISTITIPGTGLVVKPVSVSSGNTIISSKHNVTTYSASGNMNN